MTTPSQPQIRRPLPSPKCYRHIPELISEINSSIIWFCVAPVQQGFMATVWKSTEVVPIPTFSPPRDLKNDLICHISLLPTAAKNLELFVRKWVCSKSPPTWPPTVWMPCGLVYFLLFLVYVIMFLRWQWLAIYLSALDHTNHFS